MRVHLPLLAALIVSGCGTQGATGPAGAVREDPVVLKDGETMAARTDWNPQQWLGVNRVTLRMPTGVEFERVDGKGREKLETEVTMPDGTVIKYRAGGVDVTAASLRADVEKEVAGKNAEAWKKISETIEKSLPGFWDILAKIINPAS